MGLADTISKLLCNKRWDYRVDICLERTKFFAWESDILILNKSKHLEEIEIKVSVSDFKRDFKDKKAKHDKISRGLTPLTHFWFAVPNTIAKEVRPFLPSYAGLLVINVEGFFNITTNVQAPKLSGGKTQGLAMENRLLKKIYKKMWR